MKSVDTLAAEALLLPEDKRLTLAHRILDSVEPNPEVDMDAAWDTEIRQRIERYDAGLETTIPGREVFAELDRQLRK